MEIYLYKDDFIKTFSTGVEKEYRGTSIIYDDKYKVLLYHYFPTYKRLYVLDGLHEEKELINVVEKVRIVAFFENRQVSYFSKYLKSIIKNGSIYAMEDEFFVDLMIILQSKKPLFSDVKIIYDKYNTTDLIDNYQ